MIKLHLGCGNKIISDFINIDIRKNDGVDIVDDIGKLIQIEKDSVDLIYACHVLEHFGKFQYIDVLKRWHDVLRPGGSLRLAVPDLNSVFKMYGDGYPLRKLMGLIYGGQTYEQNYHFIGFDHKTLSEDLETVGFRNIRKWDWRHTEHSNIDDFSQAYIPHMDKENGMLMSLNIEAEK